MKQNKKKCSKITLFFLLLSNFYFKTTGIEETTENKSLLTQTSKLAAKDHKQTLDISKQKDDKPQIVNIFEHPQIDTHFHHNEYYFDQLEQTSQEQTLFSYVKLVKQKRKPLTPGQSSVSFQLDPESFIIGSSNQALLNSSVDSDNALYGQTIINLPLDVKVPASNNWGIVEFNFTPCLNRLWGNFQNEGVSESPIKLGDYLSETSHDHEGNLSPIFVRETWLKIYTQSDRAYFKVGAFPRKIGLGLILGNLYRVTGTILTSASERSVDQYRPGIEWHTKIGKKNKAAFNMYYSIYNDEALSLDNQVEYVQSQFLGKSGDGPPWHRGNPTKPLMQISHLLLGQFNFDVDWGKEKENKALIQPFVLYNRNHNESIEYPSDAQSSLVTLGSSFKITTPKFNAVVDAGMNLGNQYMRAWDRNGSIDTAFSYLLAYTDLHPSLEPALVVPDPDVSLDHAPGDVFKDTVVILDIPITLYFQNSYSRFRKEYQNFYKGFMFATDMGYEVNDRIKLGFIGGYASGDKNPNNDNATSLLYRTRDDWDSVRLDYCKHYGGFYSTQPIYTGINVRSLQLLRAQRFNNPISGPRDITSNFFSNIAYAGFGFWYKKYFKKGILTSNTNVIPMTMVSSQTYGFDPVYHDIKYTLNYEQDIATAERFKNHDKTLSKFLGTEINTTLEFFAKNDLVFYFILTLFLPGSYYHDIKKYSYECKGKMIPLSLQKHAMSFDRAGYPKLQHYRITLLDNPAVYSIAGIKYLFSSEDLAIWRK